MSILLLITGQTLDPLPSVAAVERLVTLTNNQAEKLSCFSLDCAGVNHRVPKIRPFRESPLHQQVLPHRCPNAVSPIGISIVPTKPCAVRDPKTRQKRSASAQELSRRHNLLGRSVWRAGVLQIVLWYATWGRRRVLDRDEVRSVKTKTNVRIGDRRKWQK
jgi:hypothetical protein